ncbi:MAG: alpha/beta hydrolase [FCB group bacterium]|nr:alpha/beta hydrolase [FCB group bacterium]
MDFQLTDLKQFCAPGATATERTVELSPTVHLRTVEFIPPGDNNNPPVVFVPGWISVMAGWHDVLVALSEDHRIYYLETREKKSSLLGPAEKLDVESIGNDIVRYVELLGLTSHNYILFGSSLGATAILDCVRRLKTAPKCLVLIGPNAVIRVPRFGIVLVYLVYPPLYSIVKPFVKWYLRHFRLDVRSDPSQYKKYCTALDNADPAKLKKAVIPLSKYSVWEFLPEVKIPTLIVSASKDVMHEPENLKRMHEILPASTLIDLETNRGTHSSFMVAEMRKYLASLD